MSKCWIPFDDMLSWLDDAAAIDFSVRSQRTGIMDQFNALRAKVTPSQDVQVANNTLLICLRDSDWASKESRLRAVTTIRSTGRNVPIGTRVDVQPEALGSDPVLAYHRLIEDMRAQIERGIGVWNAERINEYFDWH